MIPKLFKNDISVIKTVHGWIISALTDCEIIKNGIPANDEDDILNFQRDVPQKKGKRFRSQL